MGGIHVLQAVGWLWPRLIPDKWRSQLMLNTLELLAAVFGIWVEIVQDRVSVNAFILSKSNSTTATGWLHKINFVDEDKQALFRIARNLRGGAAI
jgi:hypothetical protein